MCWSKTFLSWLSGIGRPCIRHYCFYIRVCPMSGAYFKPYFQFSLRRRVNGRRRSGHLPYAQKFENALPSSRYSPLISSPIKRLTTPFPSFTTSSSPDHGPHVGQKVSLTAFRQFLPKVLPLACIFRITIMTYSKKHVGIETINGPSQIACTVMTVHIACMQTVLHMHTNSCLVLIPLCKDHLNLPISLADHYALRK